MPGVLCVFYGMFCDLLCLVCCACSMVCSVTSCVQLPGVLCACSMVCSVTSCVQLPGVLCAFYGMFCDLLCAIAWCAVCRSIVYSGTP